MSQDNAELGVIAELREIEATLFPLMRAYYKAKNARTLLEKQN